MAVLAVSGFLGTGCVRKEAGPPPVVVQGVRDVEGVDPHTSGQLWQTQSLLSNVYEGLVGFDAQMAIFPALAESWINRDDLTWEFRIRREVRFHCGGTLTADDVAYSLERARTHPKSVLRSSLAMVDRVQALPGNLVRIQTRSPDATLIPRLASIFIMANPGGTAPGLSETVTRPCGTGPYSLAAWKRGEYLKLEAFPDYWRGPAGVREGWFVSNEARFTELPDAVSVSWARPRSRAGAGNGRQDNVVTGPSLSVTYVGFDLRNAWSPSVRAGGRRIPNPFRSRLVREAIAFSINYGRLNATMGAAGGGVVSQLVPSLVFGFDPGIRATPFAPAKARTLMAETPFGDGFEVEMDVRETMRDYAEILVPDLRALGIDVKVNVLDDGAFFQKLQSGASSLYLLRFSCRSGDAQEFFDRWVHSKDPERGFGFANYSYDVCPVEGLDAEIDGARHKLDARARQGRLQAIMRRVMDERLAIPVFNEQEFILLPRGLIWPVRADSYKLLHEARFESPD